MGDAIMLSDLSDNDIQRRLDSGERIEYLSETGFVPLTDTTIRHQRILRTIVRAFERAKSISNHDCEIFAETVPLRYMEILTGNSDKLHNYFPDIMVLCHDLETIDDSDTGIAIVPDFIAEITSDATRNTDYKEKLSTYLRMGVKEYWIVDLQKDIIVRYASEADLPLSISQLQDEHSVSVSGEQVKIRF